MKKIISVVRSTATAPLLWCAGLWSFITLVAITFRPLLNTIETRAMTVAWEMSVRHSYLVPTLNFTPYTQKPPFLPWLINLGWNMVGTNRFIATVFVSAFSFGCVMWTAALAKSWWPYTAERRHHAIWLCFGAVVLQFYGTVIFYDFLLCFFVLAALFMVWQASLGKLHFFLWLGVCLGFGILTKGPVMLVHVLPVAALAPLWITEQKIAWPRWYVSLIGSVMIGSVMALCWAIPAAVEGGPDYGRWILLQQTTHRVIKAFNHQEPWWYYLIYAPLLLMPWIFYPKVWQRLPVLYYFKTEAPMRFLLCWITATLFVFSLISGKQLHYILPLWPAFALFVARLLDHIEPEDKDIKITFTPFFLFALMWLGLTTIIHFKLHDVPTLLHDFISGDYTLPVLYLAGLMALCGAAYRYQTVLPALAMSMMLTLCIVHIAAAPHGWSRFSTNAVARAVREYPGRPLATVNSRYQGEVNYLARIKKPLTVLHLDYKRTIPEYFAVQPKGIVLLEVRSPQDLKPYQVLFIQPAKAKRFYALVEKKK